MTSTKHEYRSDFARRYYGQGRESGLAEGFAVGVAEAIVAVLEARDIQIPGSLQSRIAECDDEEQLERWIRRAVTVDSAGDLFEQSGLPYGGGL